MSAEGMEKCFCCLIVFFAMVAIEQIPLVPILEKEDNFDLSEGHLITRFPLEVLTSDLGSYTKSYFEWGGIDDLKSFDKELCVNIMDLREAIENNGWENGDDPSYWSRESLSK